MPGCEYHGQMAELTEGNVFPDFTLPATNGEFTLSQQRGRKLVLYFYPRDNTSGCTREGQDFASRHQRFKRSKTSVYGVSRDKLATHEKFRAKFNFPFDLIADSEETLCSRLGLMKAKNMYGKKVRAIERTTFLLDEEGVVQRIWSKVKVEGHVDEVLAALKSL